MDWKKSKIIYNILAVAGFILIILGATSLERTWMYVGIVLMLSCTVVSLKWYRCPHCNAFLGNITHKIRECPSCGKSLEKKSEK